MKLTKPFLLALFGTFVEYYDYALYGFSAPILAQHFFPKEDPIVSLLQTYGIFLVGSCSKPFGSLIFGYLGDRFGRAFTLRFTITGIAIPTLCIGFLPGYERIGYIAPLLLLICRVFQGIFVSGESDNARIFLYEMLPEKNRCFANSLAYFTCMIGIYVASVFAMLPHTTSHPFASWRICFILGGILGIILFLLRRRLTENTLFLEHQRQSSINEFRHSEKREAIKAIQEKHKISDRFPKKYSLLSHWRPICITLLMTGAAGGQYHFYFVFFNQYLNQVLHQCDAKTAAFTTSNLLLCFALLLPLSGLFADRFAHRFRIETLLKWGAGYLLVMACVNIVLSAWGVLPKAIMYLTVIGLSFTQANTFVVILNQFDLSIRCRGVSIGHSLGSMLFSGTTPFISLWIWNKTGSVSAPLYYFLALCSMSIVALFLLESKKRHYTVEYGNEYQNGVEYQSETIISYQTFQTRPWRA